MATEEHNYEEMLRLLKQLVESMKSGTGPYHGRPTESITKSSLETMKLIQAKEKDCRQACKERIDGQVTPLKDKLSTLEESHRDLKRRIFIQVEDLGTASKTRNGHVASLESKINKILKTVYGCDEGELDDRMAYVEAWIVEEEEKRRLAKEASRFKTSTVLTVIGIVSALALGISGLIIQVMKMG